MFLSPPFTQQVMRHILICWDLIPWVLRGGIQTSMPDCASSGKQKPDSLENNGQLEKTLCTSAQEHDYIIPDNPGDNTCWLHNTGRKTTETQVLIKGSKVNDEACFLYVWGFFVCFGVWGALVLVVFFLIFCFYFLRRSCRDHLSVVM